MCQEICKYYICRINKIQNMDIDVAIFKLVHIVTEKIFHIAQI